MANEDQQEVSFKYSEQPVAVFLGTPPHNPSYNQLVSFAIDQAFNQMYQMALDNEKKCYTRVHFIIDEGGNLPKIQNLDTKFTIGLGSELLFDWVLQNKGQLRINYSKEEAETIISNCGNTLYILSKDKETAQEISDEVGHEYSVYSTKEGNTFYEGGAEEYVEKDDLKNLLASALNENEMTLENVVGPKLATKLTDKTQQFVNEHLTNDGLKQQVNGLKRLQKAVNPEQIIKVHHSLQLVNREASRLGLNLGQVKAARRKPISR